jgi:hypothetical protein
VRVISRRQDSPIYLPVTNELDTQGIHNPITQTIEMETPPLAQAVRIGTKIKEIFVKLATAIAITEAALPREKQIKIITWVMTQVTQATIIHRLTAPSNLTVPNLQIRRPQHPHRQMRTGVIDVIDHTGVTVVMHLR